MAGRSGAGEEGMPASGSASLLVRQRLDRLWGDRLSSGAWALVPGSVFGTQQSLHNNHGRDLSFNSTR